jgi:MOSC domain-containing protein YiiM
MADLLSFKQLNREELEAGLNEIRCSPTDHGVVELIVRRPESGIREVVREAELDLTEGLIGDNWRARGNKKTKDGSAHPEMQLTLMNSRVIALLAPDSSRWPLAGDQLYIDMDLSLENLPAGTRLSLGSAIVEVTKIPHTGCQKFVERFGMDAMLFVNSEVGRAMNLRGINTRVVQRGVTRVGDRVTKL